MVMHWDNQIVMYINNPVFYEQTKYTEVVLFLSLESPHQAILKHTRKSTSGYILLLDRGVISWMCAK